MVMKISEKQLDMLASTNLSFYLKRKNQPISTHQMRPERHCVQSVLTRTAGQTFPLQKRPFFSVTA